MGPCTKAYILLQQPPNLLSSPLKVQQVVKTSKTTPKCKISTLPTFSLLITHLKKNSHIKCHYTEKLLILKNRYRRSGESRGIAWTAPRCHPPRWGCGSDTQRQHLPLDWQSQAIGGHVTGDATFKLRLRFPPSPPAGTFSKKALRQAVRCFNQGHALGGTFGSAAGDRATGTKTLTTKTQPMWKNSGKAARILRERRRRQMTPKRNPTIRDG